MSLPIEVLESVLSDAVKASVTLDAEKRAEFIGKYLLKTVDIAPPLETGAIASAIKGRPELRGELQTLSDQLTRAVNAASRTTQGLSVLAVAECLLARVATSPMVEASAATAAATAPTCTAPASAAALENATSPATLAAESVADPAPIAEPTVANPVDSTPMQEIALGPATDAAALAQVAVESAPNATALDEIPAVAVQPAQGAGDQEPSMWDSIDESKLPDPTDEPRNSEEKFMVTHHGLVRRHTFRQSLGASKFASLIEEDHTTQNHIEEVARAAFDIYDVDKSGTIEKEELFQVLIEMGQVAPANGDNPEKLEFLEMSWQVADTNNDGVVDMQEFIEFYSMTIEAVEQEDAARKAFSQYDADGSNALEKHELFQVLLELDMVPGMDLSEKREYLEETFSSADVNGDGIVDFAEFTAFYSKARKDAKHSEHIHRRRHRAEIARRERKRRQASYVEVDALIAAAKAGDVALLRGTWLLQRAGYDRTTKERKGRKVHSWALKSANNVASTPLPCRQVLETETPEAYLPVGELEEAQQRFQETLGQTPTAQLHGVNAAPVVLVSYCWETTTHPDPMSHILKKVAAQLASAMPNYQAWGMHDVGVFIDWASLYQQTADVSRSDEQANMYERARNQMCMWFAHKLTTIYLITDQSVDPWRRDRAWPYFEEAAGRLFKDAPPPRPFQLPNGALATMWNKVVDCSAQDLAAEKKQRPPISAPHFASQIKSKRAHDATDAVLLPRLYRRIIEDGYNGLTRLSYSRLEWTDAEMSELASTLDEVSCHHVTELDLSYNDFTIDGLSAIGHAIKLGSLSALQTLDLSYCTHLRELPEALGELHELKDLIVEGNVGLKSLPKAIFGLGGLRRLYVCQCHGLDDSIFKELPATCSVIREKRPLTPRHQEVQDS